MIAPIQSTTEPNAFDPRITILSDEISQDPQVVAGFLRRNNLKGFELRSMFGRAFKELTAADLHEIALLLSGEGLSVFACATPVFKCGLEDAADGSAHRDIFRRSLETAQKLGCRLLRVFTFLRALPAGLPRPTPAIIQRVADRLIPLCEEAASAGILMGIENEASCLIASPGETEALFRILDHPATGVIWDPCNVLYLSEPTSTAALAEGCRMLMPRIVHIHVKDAHRNARSTPASSAPIGEGDVGWEAQFAAIRKAGYHGMFSLETHWRKKALSETELHLPAGYAFSAGGEEASTVCLAHMKRLWTASEAETGALGVK